jgi:hypothetical protein
MTEETDFKVEKPYRILVMTHSFPGYYAKGDTIAEAKKKCLYEAGDRAKYKDLCVAYLAHPSVEITGMGGWRRPHNVPDPIRLGKV